jgi:dipeptidyl aminopeptidase/acylaminoacyl peptidase
MHDIAQSVLPGAKRLIDQGIADPQRIAVIGQSDGGYAALSLLVQSRFFKAGVMVSGSGNLLEGYSYDYERAVNQESLGLTATPWNNREVLIENSPYFLLDRVQAPLLIIAGSTDAAVPPHLGEEVFSGLRDLGKDAVYVEYDGEGHDPQTYSYENQFDLVSRISAWFDKYLKDRP